MTYTSPSPIDSLFRAFADRTRLRILNLLSDHDELCVCDIIAALDLPQAKVSRHLAYLRRAGLVDTRREGQWVHYRLRQASSPLHTRLLDCLRCCLHEVPELKADRQRLARCCT
ncbi:MAG: metalloregulator ArsR/SmtB family transcription factor [Phycisphaeraceae bacterium]